MKSELYVVTGASGRTGSAVARTLLNAGKRVRVVLRDTTKGKVWVNRGCEVAVASLNDKVALRDALTGADGAYVISPQQYASSDLFEQAEIMASVIAGAVSEVQLPKLVALSSIGANRSTGTGWITMNRVLEQYLGQTGLPVTFLRAAYFTENWAPLVNAVTTQDELLSFLAPLARRIPMIATEDVGRIAAEALCEDWDGTRVIEVEGPSEYSPNDVAKSVSQVIGRTIRAVAIPKSGWAEALSGSEMSARALDGFVEMTQSLNSGHVAFGDDRQRDHRKGTVSLDTAISAMMTRQSGRIVLVPEC